MVFDYRPNAGASLCEASETCSSMDVAAVLQPDAVGLYEVRFKVPVAPRNTSPCSASVAPGLRGVTSNLTLTLIGATSYDIAPVCVSGK
jgi:hypothetical protein